MKRKLALTPAGFNDIFISKLNAFGNFVWAKAMGGTGDDYGYGITCDASGNIYTCSSRSKSDWTGLELPNPQPLHLQI